ncbi:hypothetical protein HDU87_001432 [Geranomyces variabilis]|uniref:Uncharacterized protein n=1 Tax=Geranomyces variabilis TaxID=109894 RepID=A0AAD5TB61_9FUNG|nr:hypothetical protein HDU87_001432 [Geranomyces variabilis]
MAPPEAFDRQFREIVSASSGLSWKEMATQFKKERNALPTVNKQNAEERRTAERLDYFLSRKNVFMEIKDQLWSERKRVLDLVNCQSETSRIQSQTAATVASEVFNRKRTASPAADAPKDKRQNTSELPAELDAKDDSDDNTFVIESEAEDSMMYEGVNLSRWVRQAQGHLLSLCKKGQAPRWKKQDIADVLCVQHVLEISAVQFV